MTVEEVLETHSPARYAATVLSRAAEPMSIADIAADYQHFLGGDLARLRARGLTGREAAEYLIERGLAEIEKCVAVEEDGRYRLTRPLTAVRINGYTIRAYDVVDTEAEDKQTARVALDLMERHTYGIAVRVRTRARRAVEQTLYLHELAQRWPMMSTAELVALVTSIREGGVREPILVWAGEGEDRVIDGRHRLAIASALNVELAVATFTGTEAQAAAKVLDANQNRRSRPMNKAQVALFVREFILPAEKVAANKRREEGNARGGRGKSQEEFPATSCPQAEDLAAAAVGGIVTGRTLRDLAPIDDAPLAQAAVRAGEIPTIAAARRAALTETGSAEPVKRKPARPQSGYTQLGQAIKAATHALDDPPNEEERAWLEKLLKEIEDHRPAWRGDTQPN